MKIANDNPKLSFLLPFCHLYVAFTLQMGQFVRWA